MAQVTGRGPNGYILKAEQILGLANAFGNEDTHESPLGALGMCVSSPKIGKMA